MATLTAGANSTYTGYSDGTLLAAFGSFTGTLGGATVNVVATDSASPDVIAVYTAAGSFSAVNGKPLEIDGTIYAQASCVDLSFAIYSTYTATGFSFVNTTVYAVDFAVYAGPTYVGVSTGSGGASSVPISFASSGRTAGDRLFIAVMTANQAVPALSGWAVVTPDSGTPSRGTAGAAGGVRCTVLTRVSDGTETSVTIGDSGDIQYAAGIVVRGDSGADVDLGVSIGGNAAASTSGSFTGVTTDGDNQFILTFVTTDRDASGASWSSQANANLGNLTERFDNGTATNTGGGVAIYTGEKLVAGATGTTTATQAASAAYCWITLAVKNADAGNDIAGTATLAIAPTGTMTGRGSVAGAVSFSASPTATLIGRGAVAGSASFDLAPTGALAGRGILAGSAAASISPTGALAGFGSLSGAAALSILPAATIVGFGAVSGASSFSVSPTGALQGFGLVAGFVGLSLSPSAALLGIGPLSGSTSIVFTLSATTGGSTDSIAGSATIAAGLAGSLSGTGDVSGAISFEIAASGALAPPSNSVSGSLSFGFSLVGTLTSVAYTQIINVPVPPSATAETPTVGPGGPIGSVPVSPGQIINVVPSGGQIV